MLADHFASPSTDPRGTAHRLRYSLCAALLAGVLTLAGCGRTDTEPVNGPQFVATIPPFASIVAPIVGDRGAAMALLDAGDSPHTYEPRPSDVQRVAEATALLYGAPHLDGWAADLSAPRRIALLDLLPSSFRRAATATIHGDTAHAGRTDPHFWTDPLAVRALLPELADTLCALDTAGCTIYTTRADSMAAALIQLDAEVRELLDPVRNVPVVLAQPFFRYFTDRYGPDIVGVVEPQPAHEPSPRAIQSLVEMARRTGARAVFVQRQLPPRAAEAVAEGAGIPIVTLDPLGGAPDRMTYRALIMHNATTIRNALLTASSS